MEILYRGRTRSIHDERFINALKEIGKVNAVFNNTPLRNTFAGFKTPKFDFEIITPLSGLHQPLKFARAHKKIGISMAFDLNEEAIDRSSRSKLQDTLNELNGVIVDCQYIKRKLQNDHSYAGKIWVIPYGCDFVDFADSAGQRSKKLQVIVNRNWSDIHSNEIVLKAIEMIQSEVDVCATFVGSGRQLSLLRKKYKPLEDNGLIKFIPTLNKFQMIKEFNKNWVYVSASVSDGSSVSLMEAMSAGLVCITSDFASNKEWIENGLNGFTFENRQPESLANLLIQTSKMASLDYFKIRNAAMALASKKADWRTNSSLLKNVFSESHIKKI
jgi:glycosyltransferase involved in cell wall biosynthesis